MPLYWTMPRNGDKESVQKYTLPVFFELCPVKLNSLRKDAIIGRDQMSAFKDQCMKQRDINGARFFKEEAADYMKEYRAACILLPWYSQDVGGDCLLRDLYEIGPELFPYLLRAEWMCER